ncbi:MAG: ribbon-helix-helix protein, CopG family [Candidatus Eremiobacteraeota bacterium]|nr:ribbon-helix-helix protein, CopG family [Candidatus Eremiobacteraeota bacterium]
MSKRLQVMMDEDELAEIETIARRNKTTVSEWVRQALRTARQAESVEDTKRKLQAVRRALSYNFPTGIH